MKSDFARVAILVAGLFSVLFYAAAGCSAIQRRQTLDISLDACVRIATLYCRQDIALACKTGQDLAPIIEQLLGESEKQRGVCK